MKKLIIKLLGAGLLSGLLNTMVMATDGSWKGTINGDWGNSTLWTGGVPSGAGSTATIDRNDMGGSRTITLEKDYVLGNILSSDGRASPTSARNIVLNATYGLTMDGGASVAEIVNGGNGSFTLNMNSATTSSGVMKIASDTKLENLTTGGGHFTLNGNISASDNNTRVVLEMTATNDRILLTGGLHGNVTLKVNGAGGLVTLGSVAAVANDGTYTGGTFISNGASLRGNVTGAVYGSGDITFENGGGTLNTNVNSNTESAKTVANNIVLNSAGTLNTTGGNGAIYTGIISGAGQLTIGENASSTTTCITLRGNNTYTGGTVVAGRVVYGADSNLGAASGLVIIKDGGVLNPNATSFSTSRQLILESGSATVGVGVTSSVVTWDGKVTGDGKLLKIYAGTLILTDGTNSYTGGTDVTAGKLFFNNAKTGSAAGSGDVALSAGVTSGGSGRISGNMTTSGAATLQIGYGSVAGFEIGGNLTLGGTLTLTFGNEYGLLSILGNLDLAGNKIDVDLSGYNGSGFELLEVDGAITGDLSDLFNITGIDSQYVQFGATGITILAIPEPSTYAAIMAVAVLAFILNRRRSRN